MLPMPRLILIDGSGFIFRAYHAMAHKFILYVGLLEQL